MTERIQLSADVPSEMDNERLDQIAAKLFPDYSRSRLQTWIKKGDLLVDGKQLRTRD
jgi:23S rRNA pseudouridine1911/1915/1917 synthase